MNQTSPESRQAADVPYLAKPIYDHYGYMLYDHMARLRGRHGMDAAFAEAAGLGMWIGAGVLQKFPGANTDDVHDGLGYSLPLLNIEPEVANVVYENAMEAFTSGY